MGNGDPNGKALESEYDMKGYALSGKIMLIAIVTLFVVIIIMLCLHVYARWYLLRARRSQHLRINRNSNRNSRRPHLIFYVDPAVTVASRGLDASVIASLPVFAFSHNTHPDPVECAVCLSEFEEGEMGRVLPKCNHSFHIDCIDMWFQSHSTCPLCRAPVEPPPDGPEVVITVTEPAPEPEPEPGSSSGMCADCEHAGGDGKQSAVGRRSERLGEESGCESSFRSSMSRMLSLKRILSRERKASSGSVGDAERGGGGEETQ